MANMNLLKRKYDVLFETEMSEKNLVQKNQQIEEEKKISKYNNLDYKQLLDLIIAIDLQRYEKYKE